MGPRLSAVVAIVAVPSAISAAYPSLVHAPSCETKGGLQDLGVSVGERKRAVADVHYEIRDTLLWTGDLS